MNEAGGTVPKVPELATISQLEGLLCLSRPTIYKHIRRAGLTPQPGHGRTKLYRVRPLLEAIVEARKNDNKAKGSDDLRARKLELEIELLDIRRRQALGELVEADSVRRKAFAIARTARSQLLALPERLADVLAAEHDAAAVQRLLEQEIRLALEALARSPLSDRPLEEAGEPDPDGLTEAQAGEPDPDGLTEAQAGEPDPDGSTEQQ